MYDPTTIKQSTDRDPDLVMWHVNGHRSKEGAEGAEPINWWLRDLDAEDRREIDDRSMSVRQDSGGEGEAVVRQGTVNKLKIKKAFQRVDGYALSGKPVLEMTNAAFAGLKGWMVDMLVKKINEREGRDEEAPEALGESATRSAS